MYARALTILQDFRNNIFIRAATWSGVIMELSAVLASVLYGVCVLQASAQLTSPSQLNAIVLNLCLPEETLSTRAVDPVITDTLSGIASQLIGGTRKSVT